MKELIILTSISGTGNPDGISPGVFSFSRGMYVKIQDDHLADVWVATGRAKYADPEPVTDFVAPQAPAITPEPETATIPTSHETAISPQGRRPRKRGK
jgi:hypothetical protein